MLSVMFAIRCFAYSSSAASDFFLNPNDGIILLVIIIKLLHQLNACDSDWWYIIRMHTFEKKLKMKKYLVLALLAALVACNGNKNSNQAEMQAKLDSMKMVNDSLSNGSGICRCH